jgi:hypothetical protein
VDLIAKVLPQAMLEAHWLHRENIDWIFGESSLYSIRDIPRLTNYHMYSRFVAWSPDNKWFYCQTIFTIQSTNGGIRNEHIPPEVPEDETVCTILYSRLGWKLKSGIVLSITDILLKEGYFVSDKMKELNSRNWELVKSFQDIWDKESFVEDVHRLSKL